ncbi:MAG TPA: hypothetical protein VMJ10_18080 [Kofleriaceae bacterium]|nr:hypothetical protein [Kofleriaceae bacterium]
MTRAVAVVLAMSLLLAGCFPHNKKARMYAQLAEGGSIAAGIGMEYFVSGDCDTTPNPGMPTATSSCHSHAQILGDVGVALILAGLLGFVATISTAEDEEDNKPRIEIKADAPKPVDKLPAVVLPPPPPAPAPTAPVPAPAATPDTPASAPAATPAS